MLVAFIILILSSSLYADQNKYLDILETSLDRLNEAYVDSIDEDELIKSGIRGMLKPLDPYTKLLVGSSKNKLDIVHHNLLI